VTLNPSLAEALAHGQGDERPFRCSVHDDTYASASVNVIKGLWYCYACGASGRVDGAAKVPDYADIVAAMAGGSTPVSLPEEWLTMFDAAGPSPYWASRYTPAVAERFRCGTHPVTGNPTYPVRGPAGGLWGVVQRQGGSAHDKSVPKYLYPPGVSVSTTLFNYPPLSQRIDVVVLVEGASDVMALHKAPRRWAVLGCYGSGLHARQRELVLALGATVVVTAFDADDAGRRATQAAQDSLQGDVEVVSAPWDTLTEGRAADPGEVFDITDPFALLYGIRTSWR
jgi:hypothetical protein